MAEALQNRWHHPPKLHRPGHGHERKVGWLELFYDLIYVAAIIQLGNALSENIGLGGFLAFFALMTPIWLAWTGFTFYSNRFVVDDVIHRCGVFVQMFFIGAVAVCVPDVFNHEPQGFALAYAGVRLLLMGAYLRTWIQTDEVRELTFRYTIGYGLSGLMWLGSAFIPEPWCYVVWAAALGVDLATSLAPRAREMVERCQPDVHHMTERYGLLTIIVLGESFVKVLSAVSEHGLTFTVGAMGAVALGITCFMWWLYFDDIGGSRIKQTKWASDIWIYSHLPFTVSVVAVGVAVKKAVFFAPMETAPAKYRWLLCGTLALALLSASVLDHVSERRQAEMGDRYRVLVRMSAAVFVLVLALIGGGLSAWLFLGALSTVCLLQVVFDLLGAPLAADPHSLHEGPVVVDYDDEEDEEDVRPKIVGGAPIQAVRKGTPSALRRDLYFHLMEGSWPQLFGLLGVAYLAVNALFGAAYMAFPGSVTGVAPNDFWAAFSFSVQTMATIGYGAMSPDSGVGNFIVTIEAAIGLLSVAMATGIIFAKIARPTSSVLFSEPVVVTKHEGQRTLMFRVGNARGNEVVEATMRVSVLCDEVSPEGHRMRKLRDLQLVRDNSPIFSMSWTVMHAIDEQSPLYRFTDAELRTEIFALIATMTGYDSTYAQMTHARHLYAPTMIRPGRKFVDVISPLPDGRLLIDYDQFHATLPDDFVTDESVEEQIEEELESEIEGADANPDWSEEE